MCLGMPHPVPARRPGADEVAGLGPPILGVTYTHLPFPDLDTHLWRADLAYWLITLHRAMFIAPLEEPDNPLPLLRRVVETRDDPSHLEYIQFALPDIKPSFVFAEFPDGIFVLLRGTSNLFQAFRYVVLAPSFAEFAGGGVANQAMNDAANDVFPFIKGYLDQTTKPFIVSGHSYGAAIVPLIQRLFQAAYGNRFRGSYLFGGPRVANQNYYDFMTTPLQRIETKDDAVTALPPEQLANWSQPMVIPVNVEIGNIRFGRDARLVPAGLGICLFPDGSAQFTGRGSLNTGLSGAFLRGAFSVTDPETGDARRILGRHLANAYMVSLQRMSFRVWPNGAPGWRDWSDLLELTEYLLPIRANEGIL